MILEHFRLIYNQAFTNYFRINAKPKTIVEIKVIRLHKR